MAYQLNVSDLLKIGLKQTTAVVYTAIFNKMLQKYNIETKEEAMAAVATAKVETDFTRLCEDLNYRSAERLCQVFPSKFKSVAQASEYTNNPEKLANYVYASMGGYGYIGRGLVQLTGKANYLAFKAATGIDVIANPTFLETPEGATEALFYFFKANNIFKKAKAKDWDGVRYAVNRRSLGLEEFKGYLRKLGV